MIWGLLALAIAAAFAGAVVLVSNWPYTLLGIMPTNRRLLAMTPQSADAATRALLERWGRLHAVRSGLGAIATALFLVAAVRWAC